MKTRRRWAKGPSAPPHKRPPQHGRRGGKRPMGERIALPATLEVDVFAISEDGEPLAAPADKRLMGQAQRWLMVAGAAVAKGERWLARVVERHKHIVLLEALQKASRAGDTPLIGVVGDGGRVRAYHKELAAIDFTLQTPTQAQAGDHIRFQALARPRHSPTPVKVVQNFGPNPKGIASLAAILNHNLPETFPTDVLEEAEALPAYTFNPTEGRTDWRTLPIVTIDGPDARDFDDAVWAEPIEGGGHRIIVAIADVAHYVQLGTTLDADAQTRGNSTYFPDRVIPMLPERLSNDLCSLRPHTDRPVFGVDMQIDAHGNLTRYQFQRGVIHSAARLTYQQVQAALDGTPDATTQPLLPHLRHLHEAYQTLNHARLRRGALDLELPELFLELDTNGQLVRIAPQDRLTSHKLIEELMILANVAAASALSRHATAGFYRIHDKPDKTKLQNLLATLKPLGFTTPAIDAGPKAWSKLVEQVKAHPARNTLMRTILQSQMQAKYDTSNIGHHGLALPLYSHFTSPIRRYADLATHRALLAHIGHRSTHLPTETELARVGETLNLTERISQHAEWEARDRLIAQHYQTMVGKEFQVTVTGTLNFGLFVATADSVEGLLPARALGWDWQFTPTPPAWRNKRLKQNLQAGSTLTVKLTHACPATARLTFGWRG